MHKRITFRDVAHSDVMEQYADGQLAKIIDFLTTERSPIFIDLTFTPSKVHGHSRVELRINTPHFNLISHHEGPHIYDEVDHVIDTMYRELMELKDRHDEDKKMVGRHEEFKKQR